jgi:hypothetical protein
MGRVADLLRTEERRALAELDPDERVKLPLRLGSRDLESFRLAQNPPLDAAEADRVLRRRRQQARRTARCVQELIG